MPPRRSKRSLQPKKPPPSFDEGHSTPKARGRSSPAKAPPAAAASKKRKQEPPEKVYVKSIQRVDVVSIVLKKTRKGHASDLVLAA